MKLPKIFQRASPSNISKSEGFWMPSKELSQSPGYWDNVMKAAARVVGSVVRPPNREFGTVEYIAPYYPYPLKTLYDVAQYCDIIAGCHAALRRELFRNGVEVIKADEADTEETDSEQEVNPEEMNQENDNKEKDDKQRKKILEKIECINSNRQNVVDVLKELEDDTNVLDFAILYTPYDYELDSKGEIKKKTFKEAVRVSPISMALVMSETDEFAKDNSGNWKMCSVEDRMTIHTIKDDVSKYGDDEDYPVAYNSVGKRLYPVFYCQAFGNSRVHYFEWEMIHGTRYRPNKRTGFSPVLTVWQKARTLFFQDKYLWELYEGKRPPKGMLLFNTPNQESLRVAWDDMIQRAQENPHVPPVMGVPSIPGGDGNGGKFVEYIDFMKALTDLSFVEQRDQHRREIGFVYGVSPILMNDTSTGGGLNNEGMQYTVTNRAVEDGQAYYNDKFLKRIMDCLEMPGWIIKLRPSEEQDEMAKLERIEKSLMNARTATELGLQVVWNEKTGEAVIKGGDIQSQQTQQNTEMNPMQQDYPALPRSGTPEKPNVNDNVAKAKIYLKPGQAAPAGVTVQSGADGGKFYESKGIGQHNADAQDDPKQNPLHPDSLTPEQQARWGQCEVKAKEWAKQHDGQVYSSGGHAVAMTPDGTVFDYVLDFEGPKEEYEKLVPYEFSQSEETTLSEDEQDTIAELRNVGAKVSKNGIVKLYHRTSESAKQTILSSGKMYAKEDGVFFSTKEDSSQAEGYGDSVIVLHVPVSKLEIDDIFDDEAHVKIPLKSKNSTLDITSYLPKTGSLEDTSKGGNFFPLK